MQDVFSSTAIGDPMDPHATTEAETTLRILQASQREYSFTTSVPELNLFGLDFPVLGITDEIIETAKNRLHILRGTSTLVFIYLFKYFKPTSSPQMHRINLDYNLT
jgi:hypothetical protein